MAEALWNQHYWDDRFDEEVLFRFWSYVDSFPINKANQVFMKLGEAYLGNNKITSQKLGYQIPRMIDKSDEQLYQERYQRIVRLYHQSILSTWIRQIFVDKLVREAILVSIASLDYQLD